jgi:hypothetical protein
MDILTDANIALSLASGIPLSWLLYPIDMFLVVFDNFLSFFLLVFWGFFLVELGFELEASCLLDRQSTSGAVCPALFAVITFQMGSRFLPGQPEL